MVLLYSFRIDEFLQFTLPNEGLYLLLQVIAFKCVVIVISVETTIFIPRSLTRTSLQFVGECQGSFVFDLHQLLINRGIQGGEVCEPPRQGFGLSLILAIFQPLSGRASSCLSLFLGFSSQANSASSAFMYLVVL